LRDYSKSKIKKQNKISLLKEIKRKIQKLKQTNKVMKIMKR
jgi:WD40 repeat protein